MNNLILWVAQGFGAGRSPITPGTVGSGIGVLWFLGLLAAGRLGIYFAAMGVSVALSVWCCGTAEKLLQQTDPGSVVLDEIVAVPLCFASWLIWVQVREGALPPPERLLHSDTWPLALAVFVLFRVFDVLKPWPVRQSQALPGGWGVTVDDLLAAVYVNLCVLGLLTVRQYAHGW
jgi:phosphatidylglycerophosphatase A